MARGKGACFESFPEPSIGPVSRSGGGHPQRLTMENLAASRVSGDLSGHFMVREGRLARSLANFFTIAKRRSFH